MRSALVCLGVVAVAACATRPIRTDPALEARRSAEAAEARADARLLDGCYRCLVEARAVYERLVDGPLADRARLKSFEAALLVTLREKELGLPVDASFAVAEAAARSLPVTIQPQRILDIVHSIPADAQGWGRTRSAEFRRDVIGFVARTAGELTWLRTSALRPEIRTYLTLSIGCSELTGPLRTVPAPVEGGDQPPPLLAFRGATCAGVRSVPALLAILERQPDFAEASFFVARALLGQLSSGGHRGEFEAHLDRAIDAFPRSPAVTFLAGRAREFTGDCRNALPFYERTIALEPRHDDAWLSRAVCHTTLGEAPQAIEAATRVIELGSQALLRDGYYWRALNQRHAKNIAAARSDIDAARRLGSSVDILTLAGQIEYDQGSLDESTRDLTRARQLSSRACVAAWYLGLIAVTRQIWPDAGESFELAMYCYREAASDARIELRRLANTPDLDADFLRSQQERLNEAIADAERQERWAAMNAAKGYANAGLTDKVEPLVAVATLDPSLADEIEALRTYLKDRTAAGTRPR